MDIYPNPNILIMCRRILRRGNAAPIPWRCHDRSLNDASPKRFQGSFVRWAVKTKKKLLGQGCQSWNCKIKSKILKDFTCTVTLSPSHPSLSPTFRHKAHTHTEPYTDNLRLILRIIVLACISLPPVRRGGGIPCDLYCTNTFWKSR
jgi:hypothetical protein